MKYFIASIIVLLSLISCSKSKKDVEKTRTIQVVEYKTNMPVGFATIEITTPCSNCGIPVNAVFSKLSDGEGYCDVPETVLKNEQNIIRIIKTGYWVFNQQIHSTDTKYALNLPGQEKLHLIKTNVVPDAYKLEIKARGEQTSAWEMSVATIYSFPSDSSFIIEAYGGQMNTISWNIYDSKDAIISSGGPLLVDVARTAINEVELKY